MITLVVTVDRCNLIGKNGKFPWVEDNYGTRMLKEKTEKATASIIGNTTFEKTFKTKAIQAPVIGKRSTVVMKQNPIKPIKYVDYRTSIKEYIETLQFNKGNKFEVVIVGGASVFHQGMPFVDRAFVTVLEKDYEGDVYFPGGIEQFFDWETIIIHCDSISTTYRFTHPRIKEQLKNNKQNDSAQQTISWNWNAYYNSYRTQ